MATLQRRERPRTMYATIHRLANDTPVLYLKPVTYSLTDGTPIPAPQDLDFDSTPPVSPVKNNNISRYSPFPSPSPYTPHTVFGAPAQTFLGGGPLSSHPVSPCTSPSSGTSPTSFSIGSSSPSSFLADDDDEDTHWSADARRNTWRSDKATIGNRASRMYEWMPPPSIMEEERQPQRPRFVERFLKLRNTSGRGGRYRNEIESAPLVGPQAYSFEGDGRLRECDPKTTGRMKRSASYSINLGLALHDTTTPTGPATDDLKPSTTKKTPTPHTFPRMARQKSIDLLSVVKRVSGNWWTSDNETSPSHPTESAAELWDRLATAEELERSAALHGRSGNGDGGGDEEEGDNRRTILCVVTEPAPALPELGVIGVEMDGGRLGGGELWEGIGV